jgi:glycosyltransferase involved in cell wall biosynthesis
MKKILITCSNASTYHAPVFRNLSKVSELKVLFGEKDLFHGYYSEEYKTYIKRNPDVFKGYNFQFLNNSFNKKKKVGFFSRSNLDVATEIYNFNPDIVFIFGYDTFTSFIAYITSIFLRKKIYWRGETLMKKQSFFKRFIKFFFLKIYFYFVNRVFFSCNRNKDSLKRYCDKDKLFFYPCLVDNKKIRYFSSINKNKLDFRLKKKISKDFNILTACRLTKRKNVDKIIMALKNTNFNLLVVGNGPEKANLIRLARLHKVNAYFFDFLYQKDMNKVLNKTDVFCLMSNFDASPKVVNEIMNYKIPIIISDKIGTAGDLIVNNYNGFIVKNEIELRKKILLLNKNRIYRNIFSTKSLKILDEKFNFNVAIKNIIE